MKNIKYHELLPKQDGIFIDTPIPCIEHHKYMSNVKLMLFTLSKQSVLFGMNGCSKLSDVGIVQFKSNLIFVGMNHWGLPENFAIAVKISAESSIH